MNTNFNTKKLLELLQNKEIKKDLITFYRIINSLYVSQPNTYKDVIRIIYNDYFHFVDNKIIFDKLKPFYRKRELIEYEESNKDYTFEEILSLNNDFFNSLSDNIKKEFNDYYKNCDGHIQYKKNSKTPNLGCTFMDPNTQDYLVFINKTNFVSDLCTLAHEFGHIVGNKLYHQNYYTNIYTLPDEIESMFPELLITSYIQQFDEYKKYGIEGQKYIYNNFLEMIAEIKFRRFIIKNIKEFSKIAPVKRVKLFEEYLQKKYDAKYDLRNLIDYNITETTDYPLSSLYAFSLQDLYDKDPEKALYLYEQICKLNYLCPLDKIYEIEKLGLNPVQDTPEFIRKLER